MRNAASALARVSSAAIVALGVVLLAAGLLALTTPAAGGGASASPSVSPSLGTALATASPSQSPGSPSPSPKPGTVPPTRVVVPGLGIDLPIVTTQTSYPLCDVAQFLVIPDYKVGWPGIDGRTTYLYAHARTGMFLPLLDASKVNDGESLKGQAVQVYTDDDRIYSYVITIVKRHATDFSLASSVGPDEQRLILQTSEGPKGHIPKLQVAATLLSSGAADHAAAHPLAHPSVCS